MDGKQEMVSITVLIAGRPYPLKINANDEPSIRKIVKDINDTINRFQLTYTTKDKQDCLAMVALTYAVDMHKAGANIVADNDEAPDDASDSPEFLNQLSRLENMLDNILA